MMSPRARARQSQARVALFMPDQDASLNSEWSATRKLNSCSSVLACDSVLAYFRWKIVAQQETEHLSRIMTSAALSRAVSTIAELGVADLVQAGQPQPVEHLARAS